MLFGRRFYFKVENLLHVYESILSQIGSWKACNSAKFVGPMCSFEALDEFSVESDRKKQMPDWLKKTWFEILYTVNILFYQIARVWNCKSWTFIIVPVELHPSVK